MAVVYFDTSALVKLCVHERGTPLAVALWEGADALATSRLADAEVRSVIATAERIGRINAAPAELARERWDQLRPGMYQVEVSATVTDRAAELLGRHPLRAADALHLASALVFEEANPLLFAVWDKRLAAAGRAEGLTVLPPAVD